MTKVIQRLDFVFLYFLCTLYSEHTKRYKTYTYKFNLRSFVILSIPALVDISFTPNATVSSLKMVTNVNVKMITAELELEFTIVIHLDANVGE